MLQHSSDLQNLSAMQSDAADLSQVILDPTLSPFRLPRLADCADRCVPVAQRCGTQIAGTVSLHLNRAHAGLQGVASAVEGVAATQLAFQVGTSAPEEMPTRGTSNLLCGISDRPFLMAYVSSAGH